MGLVDQTTYGRVDPTLELQAKVDLFLLIWTETIDLKYDREIRLESLVELISIAANWEDVFKRLIIAVQGENIQFGHVEIKTKMTKDHRELNSEFTWLTKLIVRITLSFLWGFSPNQEF